MKRFWSKVRRSEGCWIWLARRDKDGYGEFQLNGRKERAHRVAWRMWRDEVIPEGLFVLHVCDNPSCVKPSHLFLGNAIENVRDRDRKGRGNAGRGARHGTKTHPHRIARGDRSGPRLHPGSYRGERNGQAKLQEKDVREILRLRAEGFTLAKLGAKFGISPQHVAKITKGRRWRHIGVQS